MNKNSILKKYWGYDSFRGNQSEAIEALIHKENIVYIAKTWDGKSICYQIPAMLAHWLTIIVSPLKSLMKDQVESLEKLWIPATFLNSDLDQEEYSTRFWKLMNWDYKMLYVSPEKLSWQKFINYLKEIPGWISYFIIDEFDTVDEYGSSWFRPEYLELGDLRDELEESQDDPITIWIFTATATKKIELLVTEMMNIEENYELFRWLLIWDNLFFEVKKYENKDEKDNYLYTYLKEIDKRLGKNNGSWIIFCTTTKDVDNIYKLLKDKFDITRYHWKMTSKMKDSSFKKLMTWKSKLIVCTNAFGRWVDKKNIRYILHYWIPWNISSYLQEIWRWWRDWWKYNAITLFSNQDIIKRRFLAWRNKEQNEELNNLVNLLENTEQCRVEKLHRYFWLSYYEDCIQCDVCSTEHFIKIWKISEFTVKKAPRKKRKVTRTKKRKVVKRKMVKRRTIKRKKR